MPHVPQPAPRHPLPDVEPVPAKEPYENLRPGEMSHGVIGDFDWDATAAEVAKYRADIRRRDKARAKLGGFGFRSPL